LRYSFGIINWRTEEIKKNKRKTRKMLTTYKMHHPKPDIDRLYVKRKGGGRRLVQTGAAYKGEIISIAEYLNTNYKENLFVNIVKSHGSTQPNMNSIIKIKENITGELSQPHEKTDEKTGWNTTHKGKIGRDPIEKMENKVMHGQYIRNIDRQVINEENTFIWLSKGGLKEKLEMK